MPVPLLRTRVVGAPSAPTLVLQGELDMSSLEVFVSAVDDIRDGGAHQCTVDCRALTFADLAALRALARVAAELPGGITVVHPPPSLRRLSTLLGDTPGLGWVG